jgi:hypothetical protein
MNNYEKLIEFIINEDHSKASELFHKIVVEKSREIYESIMDDEEGHFGGDKVSGLMHEIEADENGMNEEGDELGDGDEFAGDDFGGDDEFGGEGEMDHDFDADGEMGGEEAGLENRVVDLEDALDDLKAEFDRIMGEHGDEAGDEMGGEEASEFGGEEGGMGDEMGSEEHMESYSGSGSGSGEMMEGESGSGSGSGSGKDLEEDFAFMREYVEKVSLPANKSEGHEVGSKGTSVGVNKKGTVAGKNDMGGTTANIARGGSEKAPDGTSPKTNAKKPSDLPHAGKFANVPGADAGKQWWGKAKDTGDKKETGKEAGNGKSVKINKDSEITGKGLAGNKPGKK